MKMGRKKVSFKDKKSDIKLFLKHAKKHIKLRHAIILIFLLMFNAYAWFIYATEVSTGVTAHVKSWKILFQADSTEIVDYIDIDIDDIYPGMKEFKTELKAYNRSETSAKVSFDILSARILDEEFITVEGTDTSETEIVEGLLTSNELVEKLKTEYPFKIDISVSETLIDAEYGESTYKIIVNWPFESGNDELDTLWGEKAYEYSKKHRDNPSITMRIRVRAEQI